MEINVQNQVPERALQLEELQPLLNDTFALELEDGAIELTLEEVEALPRRGNLPNTGTPIREQPFSLVFRGPPGSGLAQGSYMLDHPTLGKACYFLVPIGADHERCRLQSVFG